MKGVLLLRVFPAAFFVHFVHDNRKVMKSVFYCMSLYGCSVILQILWQCITLSKNCEDIYEKEY